MAGDRGDLVARGQAGLAAADPGTTPAMTTPLLLAEPPPALPPSLPSRSLKPLPSPPPKLPKLPLPPLKPLPSCRCRR